MRHVTTAAMLLLVAALGCGGSIVGPDGGGGAGGQGGASGGGAGGGGTTGGGGAGSGGGCGSAAGFGCLFGGCQSDIGTAPVCANGIWSCPMGAIDTTSCGGCTGNPPPGYVCGNGGWVRVDRGRRRRRRNGRRGPGCRLRPIGTTVLRQPNLPGGDLLQRRIGQRHLQHVNPVAAVTSAWTGEAAALLERAISRHGGWATWEALRCVTLAPGSWAG